MGSLAGPTLDWHGASCESSYRGYSDVRGIREPKELGATWPPGKGVWRDIIDPLASSRYIQLHIRWSGR